MTRYRQNPSIAWRQIDDESVLVDPHAGTVTVLNRLGGRIWHLLEAPQEVQDLVQSIAVNSAADHTAEVNVTADVESFLSELAARKLIAST